MFRNDIIGFLKKELIGPDPAAPDIQENGEEILSEPPRLRYGAGMLFPFDSSVESADSTEGTEQKIMESDGPVKLEGNESICVDLVGKSLGEDDGLGCDDTVTLANAHFPSAVGFSCFLHSKCESLKVTVSAGKYTAKEVADEFKDGHSVKRTKFFREQLVWTDTVPASRLPAKGKSSEIRVEINGVQSGLYLNLRNRSGGSRDANGDYFTFTLVNRLASSGQAIRNENIFFQVELKVEALQDSKGFLPYRMRTVSSNHPDVRSNQLLYRKKKTYAVGHGCAVTWKEPYPGVATMITTDMLPEYDLKPVVPTALPGISLKMVDFSDLGNDSKTTTNLDGLCDAYDKWIGDRDREALSVLDGDLLETARTHLDRCSSALERMRRGVDLIRDNHSVRRAFILMNRAMLLQQLRYGMKLREWKREGAALTITPPEWPDINDEGTWPSRNLGSWRPFQIAFILLNLQSLVHPADNERGIVDLIWFPTGGGKTEAYLGLTAFTIFLRRLANPHNSGTTVLMRYTLRLLTAQQFQRAASLICACEMIRKEIPADLGTDRISIGLWVGQGLTPNKRAAAVSSFNRMMQGNKENPFILLKCPWCGAQFGQVKSGNSSSVKGYRKVPSPSTVIFQCHDDNCDFSKNNFPVPAYVIDEEIYSNSPSLIIGTVDKFAMLPWRPEARSIFGFRDEGRVSPPELIIQDELHLISGPLGSMVGHYETLISELCTASEVDRKIRPKIIASTATISRAAEQCHALYNCGRDNVFLFPPQCLEAGDSFFAREATEVPGRMYVGVHATGLPSHATAQVRVISSLLQASKSIPATAPRERDGYWTLVDYFSSIRELGHAATLINADIREHLNATWARKKISGDERRFINKSIELTSRIDSGEIPESLQELECSFTGEKDNNPVDICLATNMISVGVDVQRLGLMAVTGQPKTTSEYIQTTSRVGRSSEYPGLVVTIYNASKPRDRSHYEKFVSYHAAIYSHVEPTSVTPFSAPVRERALHALIVGFIRILGPDVHRGTPQPLPSLFEFEKIRAILEERVAEIDSEEVDGTLRQLEERIKEWARYLPPVYGDFSVPTPQLPLMYPAGTFPHADWEEKSWQTPTSMRNVDATCEAGLIAEYPK